MNVRMNGLNDKAKVEYYKTALSNYDCENPHTFKSVCLKCNKCRSLAQPVPCYTFNFVIMYFMYFLFF